MKRIKLRQDGSIKYVLDNSHAAEWTVGDIIADYNAKHSPYFEKRFGSDDDGYGKENYQLLVYSDSCFAGGAIFYVQYEWLTLELLGFKPAYTHFGIGTNVLELLETFAKEHNLYGIKLDTWDFQAKDFYIKNGFYVWGEFKDCPPGTITYFMRKDLRKDTDA